MSEILRTTLRSKVDPKGYYFEHEKYEIIDDILTAVADAVKNMPIEETTNLAPNDQGFASALYSGERRRIIKMLRTQAEGKEE